MSKLPATDPVERQYGAIPDMHWINRRLPIRDVARALDLRFGADGNAHCWHPENHQNGDKTPSVGFWKTRNYVKCFGCDSRPLGPIDLVSDVLKISPARAAKWIADRFDVPRIARGKHLRAPTARYKVGFETPLELLVKSGLWAQLPTQAQRVLPVFLACGQKGDGGHRLSPVRVSQRALMRQSGVKSFTSLQKALRALEDVHFLRPQPGSTRREGALPETRTYFVSPLGDELREIANVVAAQEWQDIQVEVELRKEQRRKRAAELRGEKESES